MSQPARAPDRRQVLKGLGAAGGVIALGGAAALALRSSPSTDADLDAARKRGAGTGRVPEADEPTLDALAAEITSGGPGKDGIPSIDEPSFVPARDADFMSDDESVFGLEYGGEVRAYPQLILVWHEIVNDVVADTPLAVTYCPLTGTTIGFPSTSEDPLTFGTTGNLVNSNLLMYDRETDSEWPQVLGVAIKGARRGQRLDTVPLVWTTWRSWRATHPDTLVLSTDTGALRDYGADPYGSYPHENGYYFNDGLFFPVQHSSDEFANKEIVMGVRAGEHRLAIPKELIRDESMVTANLGGTSIVARWDDDLDTARVEDADTGEPADFLDAMWFAWYAFYPETEVLA